MVAEAADNPAFDREDSVAPFKTPVTFQNATDSVPSVNYIYGWSCLNSDKLQCLNTPLIFLVVIATAGISQGFIVMGIAVASITSLEKEFGFTTTQVGLLATFYDAAYGIFCIFVGYIGHRHKPRWLGLGLMLMIVGAVLVAVPKFIIGKYTAGEERESDYCVLRSMNGTRLDDNCTDSSDWYWFILIVGNVLMGIGATPLWTLGPAHIHEITSRKQSSIYQGIYYGSSALGPALGFIIGMPVLDTWTDITQEGDNPLEPSHNNWVGAWWIGFLVGAAFLFIPVIPLLGFPPLFPDTHAVREKKKEFEDTIEEDPDLKHDLKSLWPAFLALLKNPTFILLCLAASAESMAIGGFTTFLPKFVETQFHVPSSDASLYTGLIVIPGAAGGILVGGYLSSRFNWNCKQLMKMVSFVAFISTLLVTAILIGCDSRVVVGVDNTPYYNSTGEIQLNNSCNSMCQCDTRFYKPVCNEVDGRTFFSPCHAGCSKSNLIDDKIYNCTCLRSNVTNVVDGACLPECSLLPVFAVTVFVLMFVTVLSSVPLVNATFRVVPEGQGSFAMGFQQVTVRFLGFVPAPIVFGKLIDGSCYLWGTAECSDDTTNCLEYDNQMFRYVFCLSGFITKFIAFCFYFLAYKVYKFPKNNRSCKKMIGRSESQENQVGNETTFNTAL